MIWYFEIKLYLDISPFPSFPGDSNKHDGHHHCLRAHHARTCIYATTPQFSSPTVIVSKFSLSLHGMIGPQSNQCPSICLS